MNVKLDYSNLINTNIGSEHGIDFDEIKQLEEKGVNAFISLEKKNTPFLHLCWLRKIIVEFLIEVTQN